MSGPAVRAHSSERGGGIVVFSGDCEEIISRFSTKSNISISCPDPDPDHLHDKLSATATGSRFVRAYTRSENIIAVHSGNMQTFLVPFIVNICQLHSFLVATLKFTLNVLALPIGSENEGIQDYGVKYP